MNRLQTECQTEINTINQRREIMRERVKTLMNTETTCGICLDTCQYPTLITNCCTNMFCLKCITRALTRLGTNCPLCRQTIHIETCEIIQEQKDIIIAQTTHESNNLGWIETGNWKSQASSIDGNENLLNEGISSLQIECVGNIMIDAYCFLKDKKNVSLLKGSCNNTNRLTRLCQDLCYCLNSSILQ